MGNTGGLIIDCAMMNGISSVPMDSSTQLNLKQAGEELIALEPGIYNWQAALALFKLFGKSLPSGSCYSVCAGGHICGGGYGLLSRLQGLTSDYLYGLEMVTMDKDRKAKIVVATEDSEDENLRDLVWANTGSGGGHFGVITKYYFKRSLLPEAPTCAFLAVVSINFADLDKEAFKAIYRTYGAYWNHQGQEQRTWNMFTLLKGNWAGEDGTGSLSIIIQTLDLETMREFLEVMGINGLWKSDPQNAYLLHVNAEIKSEHCRAPKSRAMSLSNQWEVQFLEYPYLTCTQFLNGSGENRRFKNTGAYHTKPLTEAMLDTCWKWQTIKSHDLPVRYTRPDGSLQQLAPGGALIQLDSYGGRVNFNLDGSPVPTSKTSGAHRTSIMTVQYQCYWYDSEDDPINLYYINNFYREMYTETDGVPKPSVSNGTDGAYISYPDIELGVEQRQYAPLYWPDYDNYKRLQKTKREWDPNNTFNFAQSIKGQPLLHPSDF